MCRWDLRRWNLTEIFRPCCRHQLRHQSRTPTRWRRHIPSCDCNLESRLKMWASIFWILPLLLCSCTKYIRNALINDVNTVEILSKQVKVVVLTGKNESKFVGHGQPLAGCFGIQLLWFIVGLGQSNSGHLTEPEIGHVLGIRSRVHLGTLGHCQDTKLTPE